MPKNIMICFDGTSNHPRDAKQEREWLGFGNIEDNGITNVLKLHCLFGGNLQNKSTKVKSVKNQRSFYYSGVGTYGSKIQQIFNAGFSPSNLDIATIMHNAGEDLRGTYQDGDRLFIFGFSRGAAIARKFASRLSRYLPEMSEEHKKPDKRPIRFMGVFDTVASIGSPNLEDESKPQSDVLFEDHTISPFIEEALHLVSVDDRRIAFQPTLMNVDPDNENRVTEVWFSGAHSDVGGGFWHDGLSDQTLKFMIGHIKRRKLGVTILKESLIDFDNLKAPDGSYEIDLSDVDIKPNHKAEAHIQDRWGPIAAFTLGVREIRVNLKDKPSKIPPLVHDTVGKRVKEVIHYRPRALKGITHNVINNQGKVSAKTHEGLQPYI